MFNVSDLGGEGEGGGGGGGEGVGGCKGVTLTASLIPNFLLHILIQFW